MLGSDQPLLEAFHLGTSLLASLVRGGAGSAVGTVGPRPQRPVVLYVREPCPESRRVREALSILDLDAEIRPCPRGGSRHLAELAEHGAQIPFLIDPNTGRRIAGTDRILTHLFCTYGDRQVPLRLQAGGASSRLATWILGDSDRATAAAIPGRMLELWAFESSPSCRAVRAWLCARELPFLLKSVAIGSSKREVLRAHHRPTEPPILIDHEAGVELTGASRILTHLQERYGRAAH